MASRPICPECRNDKHINCDGSAWDDETDSPTFCKCKDSFHVQSVMRSRGRYAT